MLFTVTTRMRFPLPTLDEFAEKDADFDGFAEACRIRHENTLPRLVEGLEGWVELERQVVHCGAVADPEVVSVGGDCRSRLSR